MIISDYLKNILVCPSCHMKLHLIENGILCSSCGQVGSYEHGVLNFKISPPDEIESDFYNDDDLNKLLGNLGEFHNLHYNSNSLSSKFEKYFKDELIKIIIEPQRPFFDIGCGTGTGFQHLGYPEEIVGIDISFDVITRCKQNYPKADCICCDITNPPLMQNSLKTVFSIAALEHIFYLERFVEAIEKLLSRDGYFYVLIPIEGGSAWNIMQNIASYKYKFSKHIDFDYKKIMKKYHCNNVHTIDNMLNKFYKIDLCRNIPWRIGGNNLNLIKLYRLRKRT